MDSDTISLNETQLKILNILRDNALQTPEEIAQQAGTDISKEEVEQSIKLFEDKEILIKYKALIDWNKISKKIVKALIEVKVTPQRGYGFDRIAGRIYNFPEVTTCYLLSGAYDLLVELEGSNLQEIAQFVSEKLSPLDSVQSTVTHFILKKYKENGDILIKKGNGDERLAISP